MRYRVEQGDHLSGIAARFGLPQFEIIWNHPENAALKAERKNPHILYPGDELYIPEHETKDHGKPSDDRHRFRVNAPSLYLRIRRKDLFGEKLACMPCELDIEGRTVRLTTDADGMLEHRVSATAREAILRVQRRCRYLKIGHLDPIETRSGWRERLRNLGFYDVDPEDPNDAAELEAAVRMFQDKYGLAVDGICGPITQGKLKEVHGS
jgi:N-acetylmuramoyl-L-alanine amidase